MTTFVVVAVKDRALGAYSRPFFAPTEAAAIRSFQDEINRPGSEMHQHADDYDLFRLDEWDDVSGQFKGEDASVLILGKQAFLKGNGHDAQK